MMTNNSSIFFRQDNYLLGSRVQSKNSTESNFLDIPRNVLYGIYVFNGILALLGVFGNIFVCFIIIRGRRMYTIANIFLMNLAYADLAILAISYPLWIIQSVMSTAWPFGGPLCKIIPPLSDAFYGVSLGCLMAISAHRYRMIIQPMGIQMKFFHAKVVIIGFYGISLLTISAPMYPVMHYNETEILRNVSNETKMVVQVLKQCHWKWPSWDYERYYMVFLTTVWFVIPLLIILFSYIRIKCHLQRQMEYHWLSGSSNDMAIRLHVLGIRKALRLLAPVVIVFVILMLPWNILRVISVFKRLNELDYIQVYLLVASTMLVTNSAVNPFIYYITSNDFRSEFRKLFQMILKLLNLSNASPKSNEQGRLMTWTSGNRRLTQTVNMYGHTGIIYGHTGINEYKYSNGNTAPDFNEMFENYQNTGHHTRTPVLLNNGLKPSPTRCRLQRETSSEEPEFATKVEYDINQNPQLRLQGMWITETVLNGRFGEECVETML